MYDAISAAYEMDNTRESIVPEFVSTPLIDMCSSAANNHDESVKKNIVNNFLISVCLEIRII
jgi:hypothetical protein